MNKITITIPGDPRTKKNSSVIRYKKRGGYKVPFVAPSQNFTDYQNMAGAYIERPEVPISEPVNVKMVCYMKTRRRVDLGNVQAALLDILVHYGVLEDDNAKIVVAMDGSRVFYDKENPRAEITITPMETAENA